jgi:hypothetical protein
MDSQQQKPSLLTKIAYGEDALSMIARFATACQSEINVIVDKTGASSIIDIPEITKSYTILRNNSVKIRIVTEINLVNIRYWKKIIEDYGSELRHFSDIKVNLAISDGREYIGFIVLLNNRPRNEVIYSNVKESVKQNTFIFETLWNKGISFEQRMSEIEDGILPHETYLIDDPQQALSYTQDF